MFDLIPALKGIGLAGYETATPAGCCTASSGVTCDNADRERQHCIHFGTIIKRLDTSLQSSVGEFDSHSYL